MNLLALNVGVRGPFRRLVHHPAHLAEPPAGARNAAGTRRTAATAITSGEADFELLRIHDLHLVCVRHARNLRGGVRQIRSMRTGICRFARQEIYEATLRKLVCLEK